MIIFGLAVFFFGATDEGMFHCPNCGGDRHYKRKVGRRWFTLFFLPVIPLNKVGEVVVCDTCKTKYRPEVLATPTASRLAEANPAALRAAACLVLHADQPAGAAARRRAVEAIRGVGQAGYDDAALTADLAGDPNALAGSLSQTAGVLAPEAREWLLAEAVRIGLADGPLSDYQRRTITSIGSLLQLTQAQAYGVISMAEQSTQASG